MSAACAAAVHRQKLARVVAVERDQVGDLLALRLGHLEALSRLDLEAVDAGRRQGYGLAEFQNCGGFRHAGLILRVDSTTVNLTTSRRPLARRKSVSTDERRIRKRNHK